MLAASEVILIQSVLFTDLTYLDLTIIILLTRHHPFGCMLALEQLPYRLILRRGLSMVTWTSSRQRPGLARM